MPKKIISSSLCPGSTDNKYGRILQTHCSAGITPFLRIFVREVPGSSQERDKAIADL